MSVRRGVRELCGGCVGGRCGVNRPWERGSLLLVRAEEGCAGDAREMSGVGCALGGEVWCRAHSGAGGRGKGWGGGVHLVGAVSCS